MQVDCSVPNGVIYKNKKYVFQESPKHFCNFAFHLKTYGNNILSIRVLNSHCAKAEYSCRMKQTPQPLKCFLSNRWLKGLIICDETSHF